MFLRLIFYCVLLFIAENSFSQNGFHRTIKIDIANGIIGSAIDEKDNLILNNLSFKFNKGWKPTIFVLDSNLLKIKETDIYSYNNLIIGASYRSSINVIKSKRNDEIQLLSANVSNTSILFTQIDKNYNIISKKEYKKRLDKRDNHRPYGVLETIDSGKIIYGSYALETANSGNMALFMKIDHNGKEVYWKTYGFHPNFNSIDAGIIESDSTAALICSQYFTQDKSWRTCVLRINTFSGEIIEDITLSEKDSHVLKYYINGFTIYKEKDKFKIVSLVGKPNEPTYKQAIVTLNNKYAVEKVSYVDLENTARKFDSNFYSFRFLGDPYYSGVPYQSTIDKDGNIYLTTKGFYFPTSDESNTAPIKEYVSITKFNSNDEIVYETIDSFDTQMMRTKNKIIYPLITSVSVASSGSVFLSGVYEDNEDIFFIDTVSTKYWYIYKDSVTMRDTFELRDTIIYDTITNIRRSVGFVLKYDKNGCRVAGCNIVGTDDPTPISEQKPTLYPNPAANKIYIKLNTEYEKYTYEIYDATSKLMLSNKLEQDEIDIGMLNTGIYFVVVKQDGRVVFRDKVVKM